MFRFKQRIDEFTGVELTQILDAFADADEADGNAQFLAIAKMMPPLAVPSSLVSAMPVSPTTS